MFVESGSRRRAERDAGKLAGGLRGREDPLAVAALELVADGDRRAVHIVPGEPQQLALAQPGDEGEAPERVQPVAAGCLEELSRFVER